QVAAPDIVKSRDIFKDLAEHTTAAILTAQKVAAEYSDPLKLRALELADAEALKARSALGGE
ncbi:MAG: hypothetical protein Q8P48_01295, partial [Deltaproteobacteria bacterium]|nr:hypothetical protein [Deltaproteobacteria bacterium]